MLVVLPFHHGDKSQAVTLANWIRDLGQVSDHNCLLCVGEHCEPSGVIEPFKECFKSVSVFTPKASVKRGEGPMGYARAANAMWQSVAWKIYFQEANQGKRQVPWLWLEPDAIPTRPSWLREIHEEYHAAKKPFMGAMGQAHVAMLNGVAVYPSNVADYAPLALQCAECPWDLNAAPQILKHANVTDLFQHIYQVSGESPTFPRDKDKLLQSAALFHRCKDGSLISYLKENGYTTGLRRGGVESRHVQVAGAESAIGQSSPLSGGSVPPATPSKPDDNELLGEPVDYAERMEQYERTHRAKPRVPNEGERNGDLIWREGKWHTFTEPMKSDRASVTEKYKHPEKQDLPVAAKSPEATTARSELSEVGNSAGAERNSGSGGAPSRDDLIKEAVGVLKKLCANPKATSAVRKELKRQKVVK